MPLPVYRLRRLLVVTAVLLTALVVGMYFYARSKATNVLKQLPGKIGYDIKQTANGFQFSKSDGKRTLFSVQAASVKQFKMSGNAELHDVSIILYGRDSSRYDQIYGEDFAYDQKTGDVTAQGDVQIDLVANPAGLASPDQSTPKELKNPIHLKTRNLVFNKDSGNAMTVERVEFSTPQATGWAMGVHYAGKSNVLSLGSQIHVTLNAPYSAVIEAEHGSISNDPREITLDHPRLSREDGFVQCDRAVFHLGQENQVERVLATGNVTTEARMPPERSGTRGKLKQNVEGEYSTVHSHADQAEFLLQGKRDLLRTAILSGNVEVEQSGLQPMRGNAGRVVFDFAGRNQLQKIHALDGVRLSQKAGPTDTKASSSPQDFELTAPIIDFRLTQGHILRSAITSGAAQITISQLPKGPAAGHSQAQRTVVTAGKFEAQFATIEGRHRLASVHGAPDARIVNSSPGEPDRISTSDSVTADFRPQGGIEALTQQGNVAYTDLVSPEKRTQAWANSALYTPSDQMLVLSGNPRVTNGGMATTATTMRINRATGEALAQNEVKTTYSNLKEQPDGALLASSSPIHVTASSMSVHKTAGVALYSGNVRLWQDANVIEAPQIQFDRDHRSVAAQGIPSKPVETVLVQPEKPGKVMSGPGNDGRMAGKGQAVSASSPISITAAKLTYTDSERRVHYQGGVTAQGSDFTATANTLDAYLLPRSQDSNNQKLASPGQLDHMVAEGNVIIRQAKRRAEGQKLVYTAAEDKFVLTGGSPSIFDAEQGKITGVSLTFFRRDDRVLVEGGANAPAVTQSRVAR